jgi:hypothetical protein
MKEERGRRIFILLSLAMAAAEADREGLFRSGNMKINQGCTAL